MGELDCLVVGAGLIGSASARWAATLGRGRVGLVGPGEEEAPGAWQDEGRITRSLDRSPVWSVLAAASISRYTELERKTGVQFFTEVGLC